MSTTAVASSKPSLQNIWYLIPFIILIGIYAPALSDLIVNWYEDDNYSHGFLVPLVSGYLIWTQRKQLSAIVLSHDILGIVPIVIGMGLFILGNGASEYFTVRFSFLLVLCGLVCYLFGRAIVRANWFAFFFLLFMIPIPYVIYYAATFPMQAFATTITVFVLDTVGMGVVRQGNIIHIAGHSLEVAEACSGMRSLVSLLALGALFAHTSQRRFLPQIILFLSTIPIAVFANVVRVFTTTVLVGSGFAEVTTEPWHSIMGLMVFVIAFVMLFVVGLILKQVFK
ncbi:MAG: exosortase/archaeosortase family protein [candidate division Zixibacteria bacterium]|nr:exosortase/archaeosortase family protein [candidate division Zixibacteria bacterium]